jgi:small subunit ribosomal protein S9
MTQKKKKIIKPHTAIKKKRGRPRKEKTEKKGATIAQLVKSKEPKRDYIYAVGRRKEAVARVRLYKNGSGKILVNKKDLPIYFPSFEFQKIINSPRMITAQDKNLDFIVKVSGGGKRGQAECIRHGLARALCLYNSDFKVILKKNGYLTRDARSKERKKYGLKRARRAPQWQKR